MNQFQDTSGIGAIPFKLVFSNLRKFVISFVFNVTKISPTFAILNRDEECVTNSYLSLEIEEQSSGSYALKNVPNFTVFIYCQYFCLDSKFDRKSSEIGYFGNLLFLYIKTDLWRRVAPNRIWRKVDRIGQKF